MLQMLLVGMLVATQTSAQPPAATHDRAFWRSIIEQGYAPPDGAAVEPLVRELSTCLASPDPELRDEFGYSILTAWIVRRRIVPPDTIRVLMREWTANLRQDIGSRGTDAVFRRSFSALMLSVIVAHDNTATFLDAADVQALLAASLAYLHDEQDIRGYDARTGWMHSAAHTADLLKFLGRSRFLAPADQTRILDAIAGKLREASDVFTHGEDERLARAILSIVNRQDFDAEAFASWVTRSKPKGPQNARPDPAILRSYQNATNLFAKLDVLLTQSDAPSAPVQKARDAVRGLVKELF